MREAQLSGNLVRHREKPQQTVTKVEFSKCQLIIAKVWSSYPDGSCRNMPNPKNRYQYEGSATNA